MDFLGIKKEQFAAVYMAYLLSVMSLLTSANVIFGVIFGSGFMLDTVLVEGTLYILLILTFSTNGLKLTRPVVGFVLLATVAAILSMVIEPGTRMYILGPYENPFLQKYTPRFFIYCFSGFVAASYIEDTEYFFRVFEKISYLTVILAILTYYVAIQKGITLEYMTFSYNMLLQVTFLAIRCLAKFDWKKFICASVGIFVIFIAGCRGALVSCLLSIATYSLTYKSKNILRKGTLLGIIAIIVLILFFNFEGFLQSVGNFLEANNINSRTVSLIMEGEFLEDSGRKDIQEQLVKSFNLFGHGMYSDRLVNGSYAHNIFYELLYHYGYVLGGGLFVGLCVLILFAFFRSKGSSNRVLMCSLLSAGFIKFFFSSTYLNPEPALYSLLGLCITILKEKNYTE